MLSPATHQCHHSLYFCAASRCNPVHPWFKPAEIVLSFKLAALPPPAEAFTTSSFVCCQSQLSVPLCCSSLPTDAQFCRKPQHASKHNPPSHDQEEEQATAEWRCQQAVETPARVGDFNSGVCDGNTYCGTDSPPSPSSPEPPQPTAVTSHSALPPSTPGWSELPIELFDRVCSYVCKPMWDTLVRLCAVCRQWSRRRADACRWELTHRASLCRACGRVGQLGVMTRSAETSPSPSDHLESPGGALLSASDPLAGHNASSRSDRSHRRPPAASNNDSLLTATAECHTPARRRRNRRDRTARRAAHSTHGTRMAR